MKRESHSEPRKTGIFEALEKLNEEFEQIFAGEDRDLKLIFRPYLENAKQQWMIDHRYDPEFEERMGNPPINSEIVLDPLKKDLDSLVEVAREFKKRKPLSKITPEQVVLLRNVLYWFKESPPDDDKEQNDLYRLAEYLQRWNYADEFRNGMPAGISKITLSGLKDPIHITNKELIYRMIRVVPDFAQSLGKKPERGRPKSKLLQTLEFFREPIQKILIREKNDPLRLTVEFLHASFEKADPDGTPDFDTFKKTIRTALKGKKIPSK